MDLALAFDLNKLRGDLSLGGDGRLLEETGLTSAIMLSLFTHRRADRDDTPPGGPDDRRGWWGDLVAPVEADLIGSRLWLLQREKLTVEAAERGKVYILEALQWLLDDGVARSLGVDYELMRPDAASPLEGVGYVITVQRPAGGPHLYRYVWTGGAS